MDKFRCTCINDKSKHNHLLEITNKGSKWSCKKAKWQMTYATNGNSFSPND